MKIATLTLNPAIDHICTTETVQIGEKNLLTKSYTFYGGKGINAAFTLGKLGLRAIACGLIGEADLAGLRKKMQRVEVETRFIPISQRTRHAFKFIDSVSGKDTEFNEPGANVSAYELEKLMNSIEKILPQIHWLLICGSLPSGVATDFYARLITRCREQHVSTLLDTSGDALSEGMKAKPSALRINRSEWQEIFPNYRIENKTLLRSMRQMFDDGINNTIISLGAEGLVGFDGHDAWLVTIPKVNVVSLTGAGDTMSAGIVNLLTRDESFDAALRFGGALASASTANYEPGDFRAQDLKHILENTSVRKLTDL